jgi:hypothetical protein
MRDRSNLSYGIELISDGSFSTLAIGLRRYLYELLYSISKILLLLKPLYLLDTGELLYLTLFRRILKIYFLAESVSSEYLRTEYLTGEKV